MSDDKTWVEECVKGRWTNRVGEKNFSGTAGLDRIFIHSFMSGKQGWSPRPAFVRHCITCNFRSIGTEAYIEQSPRSRVFLYKSML